VTIRLRELARKDVPIINTWRQDRALTNGLGAPHRHIGLEVDEAWFERYLTRRGVDVRCAICRDGESEAIGLVSLTGIDAVHHHAEFHIIIGDREAHGQGVGTEATRAMLRHGFRDLNLHRIFLTVLASNDAAIRVYEKAGFEREGTLRQAAFKNGAYQDLLVMAVLQPDFERT
jgi:RimJ/RimL family protein N-acetyltransferase